MNNALTSIGMIIISVSLYFTYISSALEKVDGLQAKLVEYNEAIDKASELQEQVAFLMEERGAIPLPSMERLEIMLPDSFNEVGLLNVIRSIAQQNNLVFSNISIIKQQEEASPNEEVARAGDALFSQINPLTQLEADLGMPENSVSHRDIVFNVTGDYEDFLSFLRSLEKSVQIFEVLSIKVGSTESDLFTFSMKVRAFALMNDT